MKDYKALSRTQFDRQARSVWGKEGYHSQDYPYQLAVLRKLQPASVLDVGCGGGAFLSLIAKVLPDARLTGLDLSANMVETAKRKLGTLSEVRQGDVEAMPLADETFDAVTCNESFHHYPNAAIALNEIHRVLKHGGSFLLCDMAMSKAMRAFANRLFPLLNTGDVRAYSEEEICAMLNAAGFGNIRYEVISRNSFLCLARKL